MILPFLIGIIAGLRAMTAPAAVSWAAHLGWLALAGTPLAFMGHAWVAYLLTLPALAELVTDQLPSTPSRKVPIQFAARLLTGSLSGACIGAAGGSTLGGTLAGALGAVVGTLGGAELRGLLARAFGRDLPAALLEDALALLGAYAIVASVA